MVKKKAKAQKRTEEPVERSVEEPAEKPPEMSAEKQGRDTQWLVTCAAITAVATLLRFVLLTLKPMHHDEGVNGFFLTNLFRDGKYTYDPANYHGPTLYYISLAFAKVFGLNTAAVRMSVAVWGVLMVVVAFYLKRYIGRAGAIAAAVFLTLSPGMVFISRYFIHEIFFVFLSLTFVISVVYFIEKKKAGPGAIAWLILLLLVCFVFAALPLGTAFGGIIGTTSETAILAYRFVLTLIGIAIAYFLQKILREWQDGRPIYILLAAASASLLFATKETTFITLGTMLIACFCVWIWKATANGNAFQKNRRGVVISLGVAAAVAVATFYEQLSEAVKWTYNYFVGPSQIPEPFALYTITALVLIALATLVVFAVDYARANETSLEEPVALTWAEFRKGLGSGTNTLLIAAAAAITFAYLFILFFSSFFSYADGIKKAFEAYAIWTKTGNNAHTQNGALAYLKWGMKVEAPLLIMSAVGAAMALLKAKHRFAMFTAFWAFGLLAAYSIIPYKTPWLALSFHLPMCIVAGYGINELVTSKKQITRVLGAALAIVGCVVLAYQTYDLNFVRYDDEEMGYVYAHSKRPMLDLVAKVQHYAEKSGKGDDVAIAIVSPDYWPLTWYFNDYKKALFHGRMVDVNADEMIIAKKGPQDAEVIRRYGALYDLDGVYRLRPGVDLMLLVRKNLADPDAQDAYKINEYIPPK